MGNGQINSLRYFIFRQSGGWCDVLTRAGGFACWGKCVGIRIRHGFQRALPANPKVNTKTGCSPIDMCVSSYQKKSDWYSAFWSGHQSLAAFQKPDSVANDQGRMAMSTSGTPAAPPMRDKAAVALNSVAAPFVKLMRYNECAPVAVVRSAAKAF